MAYFAERYAGLDFETLGTDESAPGMAILEIGIKIIDARTLTTVAEAQSVLHWDGDRTALAPFVQNLHERNGLFAECAKQDPSLTASAVGPWAADFILQHTDGRAPLFGNSVGFDKAWAKVHMPHLLTAVSHRTVDVSSIAIECAAQGHEPPFLDGPHRSLPDLERSLHIARWARGLRVAPVAGSDAGFWNSGVAGSGGSL